MRSLVIASLLVTFCSSCSQPVVGEESQAIVSCTKLPQQPVGMNSQPIPGFYFGECVQAAISGSASVVQATAMVAGAGFECRPLQDDDSGRICDKTRAVPDFLFLVSESWNVVLRDSDDGLLVEANHYMTGP